MSRGHAKAYQMNSDKASENSGDMVALLLKVVRELAAELHPHHTALQLATLDSALDRDLGLDSLARVELLTRIERSFGVTLREQAFADTETPRDLLRAVLDARGTNAPFAAAEIQSVPLGEAQAPHTANTLVDVLNWHVRTHPDRPHIQLMSGEDAGELITYRQLKERAEAVAAGLQQRGFQPGERAVIMLPTAPEYFFSFFGVLIAGGIPVPIYPPMRPTQIEDHLRRHRTILATCLATTLITVPQAKRLAQLLKSQVDTLRQVVTVEELTSTVGSLQTPTLSGQDIAFLQYTSGSTGNPKGVVLTHANLLANIRIMGEALAVDANDVFVSWLPLYHDMGLIGFWFGSLYNAALLVVMPPLTFLSRPRNWLWAIHRYRGTLSASPNFGYELCLRRLEDEDLKGLDLSAWRIALNGAEPVSPETIQGFCERYHRYGFRPSALMPVYGLAECSVGLAFPPLGRGPLIDRIQRGPFMRTSRALPAQDTDTNALRFVSCGAPLPGYQVRIVDSKGRELPERQEGQLEFQGPSATSGYFHNPEATRRLFNGKWLNSGDLAYIAAGEVYITGRSKDIIIRAGRNIYPHELEEAVGNVAGIRKGCVAVFGSIDLTSGTERLIVLAETREENPTEQERLYVEINALGTDLLGTPPDDVVLAPPHAVPKTSSGKIRRQASRELYEQGRIGKGDRALWWQVTRVAAAGLLPQLRRARRAASAVLYASYAWSLYVSFAPFIWLSVVLLPRVSWRWRTLRAMLRFLARVSGIRLTLKGFENLPPKNTPCVLVSNHASYLDGGFLIATLPREMSFVAKAELGKQFYPGVFLRRIQAEFVERFDMQQGATDARRMVHAARAGRSLLFFPEATFTRMPGLLPFHMGAFLAAVEANIAVVPIAIRGNRSILRAGSWFPRRGQVLVTIGKPIHPEEAKTNKAADSWTKALKLRDATRANILRYCGEPDLAREQSPV
jgi:Acyl-CoA synthetases (AMP-forming)/AMP-acid ligases II